MLQFKSFVLEIIGSRFSVNYFNAQKYLLRIPVLCFFLLQLAIAAQAQTDYIIKNDGSKLMGELKKYSVKKVKFVASGEKKAKSFKPTEISEAYKAGQKLFRSVDLPGNKGMSFLQVLEDGRIKLYEYFKGTNAPRYYAPNPYTGAGFVGGSVPLQYWYAQKDNGMLIEIKSNQIWGSRKARKDGFLALIADNSNVLNRYNTEEKFTFDFVRSLVEEYNKQDK